jgi:hypothetical protein
MAPALCGHSRGNAMTGAGGDAGPHPARPSISTNACVPVILGEAKEFFDTEGNEILRSRSLR